MDLYGLPVHRSEWLPDQILVGGREVNMPLWDNIYYSSLSTNTTVSYWPTVYGDAFFTTPPEVEKPKVEDDDMAWLTRRVEEICWVPA